MSAPAALAAAGRSASRHDSRATAAAKRFADDYGKWPEAVSKIIDDLGVLVDLCEYPGEH